MKFYMLEEDGRVVITEDWLRWAAWYGNSLQQRRVLLTSVSPGVEVSTVFLGRDHNFGPAGPPVLWETLVFGGKLDEERERYRSLEDARAGHEAMVQRVRESL